MIELRQHTETPLSDLHHGGNDFLRTFRAYPHSNFEFRDPPHRDDRPITLD
jgi:hypothetical protein